MAGSLPFAISGTDLANDVHAESLSNAALINIVGQSPNAIRAQEIAAAATTAFLTEIRGNGVVVPQLYGRPVLPDKPATPRTKLVLTAIAALAVILGLAAGLVWDRLFGHVNGAGELAEIHDGAPDHARDNPRVG